MTRSAYKSRLMLPPFTHFAPLFPDIQTFLATGTWYRPPGIEYALVIEAGGGAGGGGGNTTGGAGGGGGECKTEIVDVRGVASVAVTIGAGSAGGLAGASCLSNGAASSFGALLTAAGGILGQSPGTAPSQAVYTKQAGVGSGVGAYNGNSAYGFKGAYGAGGQSGVAGAANNQGGGGGGSYGAGGAGGGENQAGSAAAANTGGGGGGGGSSANQAGGAGGSGICIVILLPKGFTLP